MNMLDFRILRNINFNDMANKDGKKTEKVGENLGNWKINKQEEKVSKSRK